MAAFDVSFKVEGLDGIKRTFKEAARESDKETGSLIREQVNRIRDKLRERAPKKSGTLQHAIISRMGGRPGFRSGIVRITHGKGTKNDAFYWYWVEFGTAHADATPFIVPTLESERGKVYAEFREKFYKAYAKALQAKAQREGTKA